ncbi:sarcosine oxidase subunit alpha family protein [Curvivirga aplysinae]|uniref:sarcosine oxidase subunit alpha family protein n=1 Tax=Curvivirga aplysinae TaxID=2529852 RepID=UPI0012BD1568|nr:sarcosine oxidase subunit alpha family protein [Curvivirga aplysinae]MTI11010.1 sarcosine oxidase subunit alpha family protein [Curvivirga aplysinae]
MTKDFRIKGGVVNRDKKLNFRFEGKAYEGYEGDTLASALLANGERVLARSFKYHRPRGVFSAGSEEPNALVTLREGAYQEPNVRATVTELYEGLVAKGQNYRGCLKHDLMAINDLMSPFLSAGFYYKTFMWPAVFWEKLYEPIIRKAAGLGELSMLEDPDAYDKGFLHCDLLMIGSGPSGLMAALAAGRAGLHVILTDEDFRMGGRLNAETQEVDGKAGHVWAEEVLSELEGMKNVRLLSRTTVYGAFDHGIFGALERVSDHKKEGSGDVRQILWRIYSKRSILAAGAIERSIAFGNNDRPGIMMAGAARAYANRYGVALGQNISVFTNNDDGWQTTRDLHAKGVNVAAIIDSRSSTSQTAPSGVETIMNTAVMDTKGRHGLNSITLTNGRTIKTDGLAVSGGWSPAVHLTCHQRGRPAWNEDLAAFLPGGDLPVGMSVVGSANGTMTLSACLNEGLNIANKVIEELGAKPSDLSVPKAEDETFATSAFWHVKESKKRAWVDLQNDVTAKDVKLSHQEGFRAVEHLKRYTTLGMATDQGKTSNMLGLAIMAEASGKTIPEVGTTMFRPPYSPVSLSALAGRSRGKEFRPTRLTPSHQWAEEQGAVFVEAGAWLRAQWYPKDGETHWRESVNREAKAVRESVGLCDVSTLGKIDVQGSDTAEFLNRIYANGFVKLPVGKTRYGIMLREDGMVMDDGTTARLAENHFLMTTTTANAVGVFRHMEFCKQCLWPDLDVQLISATEQYAQFAVAGPNSRKVLEKIVDKECDISNDAFPFMACGDITVCGGIKARLFRISFSGELAYEIAVPARYGDSLVRVLMDAGKEFNITPYGTEALNVLRIEKGHATGNELNGQSTALNLGMDRMVSRKKDFIGNVLYQRENLVREDALKLVGFKSVSPNQELLAGSHFIGVDKNNVQENDQGWMTSVCYSPNLESFIGLGYIKSGDSRMGERVRAVDLLSKTETLVEIVSPHFVDPEGSRLRD